MRGDVDQFLMSYFVPKLPQNDKFNMGPKNAKNWYIAIKCQQKAKNYLNMTNIDKNLRFTSKVHDNKNLKTGPK